MEQQTTPHWSYSSLACFLQCPLKYALRYIERAEVERTSVSLPFGRAFHAVLSERARKGSDFKLEEAQADFAVYFRGETDASENLSYKQGETFDTCLNKGFDMLAVALENWQDDYVVKAVAEPFSVTIPGIERPLIGEFDLVVTDGGDEAVVDWKTSTSRWPVGKADRELQATAYCYAYRQLHGVNPIFRYDVFTKAKEPTVSNWYTVRSAEELERFAWLVGRIEKSVETGVFYPVESVQNCGECPYRNRCRNWKGA